MKIVVPTDQSQRDPIILPYVAGIASRLEASLALIYVVPTLKGLHPGSSRAAEAYLAMVAEELREQGLEVDPFVGHGEPSEFILRTVLDLPADMVVMATRGRHGMSKMMFGSCADAVLRCCPVPVLVLNADYATEPQGIAEQAGNLTPQTVPAD